MEITTAGLTPFSGRMKPVALVAIAKTMKAVNDADEACARNRSLKANTPTTIATMLIERVAAIRICDNVISTPRGGLTSTRLRTACVSRMQNRR